MANTVRNKPGIENATLVEDNRTLDSMMEMYEKNKNRINTIVLVVLVVIVGYFAYDKLYMGPRETKAANSIAFAQRYFEADSLQRALN
ncbi:MAG: tetratricopeptide repeat protein, partial [Flavipsychrobacter sp.]